MMADKDLEKIKKLSPQERIKRLKEIEKQHAEELENAKKLIKESEKEIKESSEKTFPLPEHHEVDVHNLFTRGRAELEEKVAEEKINKEAEQESARQYVIQEIRYAPREELRENWEDLRTDIYNSIQYEGSPTEQQMNKLENMMYATQSKMRDGSYVRDSKNIHQAAKRLMDRYKG